MREGFCPTTGSEKKCVRAMVKTTIDMKISKLLLKMIWNSSWDDSWKKIPNNMYKKI
jgi:hypothetical protein